MRPLILTLSMFATCPAALARDEFERPPEPPLHSRIDALLAAEAGFAELVSPRSSDAEFLRRVHLDLTGRLPHRRATREFLADNRADKRAAMIRQLLESPEHARQMQYVLDQMIMERRGGGNVAAEEWQKYLRESTFANKSWRKLVVEILTADGAEPAERGRAKFYLDREFNIDQVTRDVGRVFLGVDLECAQCHDHPAIDDYLQRHYYGISAFLKRSYLFTDPKSKKKMLGEKADGGEVKFTSVFTDQSDSTNPRLLDLPEINDPKPDKKPYLVEPTKKVRGVPKYSRRGQLPRVMVKDENVAFRRNVANRIWALMMGRGIVEPLDVLHNDNPASHPALLELLGDELAARDYDIRWLLEQLALTEAYQRSSQLKGDSVEDAERLYAVARLKPLSAEQLAWSLMVATGVTDKALAGEIEKLTKKKTRKAKAGEASKKDSQAKQDDAGKDAASELTAKQEDPRWREEAVHEVVKPHVAKFVALYGDRAGQKTSFDATAEQALFLLNGQLVRSWLEQRGGLAERLEKLEDPAAAAEELYISVLAREPSDEESAEVAAYLKDVGDRETALRELIWALISSTEFRFNH